MQILAFFRVQANDFGSEVIPGAKDMGMHIQAYLYDGYWEDIGTVEAFYEANLALTDSPKPKFRCAPCCPCILDAITFSDNEPDTAAFSASLSRCLPITLKLSEPACCCHRQLAEC